MGGRVGVLYFNPGEQEKDGGKKKKTKRNPKIAQINFHPC